MLSYQHLLRFGAVPIGLAVGGGFAAWWLEDWLASNRWVTAVMGALAGLGVGLVAAIPN